MRIPKIPFGRTEKRYTGIRSSPSDSSDGSTTSMAGRPLRPFLILLVGILAISWAAILVRLCEAPATVIAAYRLGLSTLILTPGYLWTRRSRGIRYNPRTLAWIGFSGICLGLHFIAWIEAVQRIPVALAVTLASTHPIFVGILSRWLLGEPLGRGRAMGIALACVGTAAMGIGGRDMGWRSWEGYGFALAAAIFFSLYMMIGRNMRRTLEVMAYVVPTYGAATLVVAAVVWFAGLSLTGYAPQTFAMFVLLALVPTAMGHSSLNWALGHVSATVVAISVLGEPVGATILAGVLLREVPDPLKIGAGLVILTGIYFAARSEVSASP